MFAESVARKAIGHGNVHCWSLVNVILLVVAKANALTTNSRPHRQVYIQFVYERQFYRALLDTV
jgi:hypothetical protein